MSWWDKRTLGRTGLAVSRLGLGSGYGLAGRDVERAVERGVNYLYWGSRRHSDFGRGVAAAARRGRDQLVIAVQSYARVGVALRISVERALRGLGIGYADVLVLGLWNQPPPERVLDAALTLREAGLVRHLVVSCHHRPTFQAYVADPCWGAIMVRYNAAHRGAEDEVFPSVQATAARPGVVAFTATRWGALVDRRMVPAIEPVPRASDCYRFVIGHPAVDVALCGPRDGAELDEAMAALDRGRMDAEELAWMARVGDGVRAAAATAAVRSGNVGELWERVRDRVAAALGRGPGQSS
jgi:aryl-alcohol dehydrogenase-like predicted oxidoreductase